MGVDANGFAAYMHRVVAGHFPASPYSVSEISPVEQKFQPCVKIFARHFKQPLSYQTYTLSPSLVEIYWKIYLKYIVILIKTTSAPFLGIPSVVFTYSQWVALKRASLLVMRSGCRLGGGQSYCRCLEWPPLAATAMYTVRHLVKFATALLTCSCGNSSIWSARRLSVHISRLRLRLGFMVLFQHGGPDVTVQWPLVQIWGAWGSRSLLNEPVQV